MLAFLDAGDARRKGPPPGLAVLSVASRAAGRWSAGGGLLGGLLGGFWLSAGGGWAAVICGGNSAVFNQLLTTFLVVAMVWRLTVFFLCSYRLFWRRLGAIPVAWGRGGGGWSGGGLGGTVYRNHQGRGSGKRTGVFLRWGKIYSPTSSTPLSDLGGSGKHGHPLCKPAAENDQEAFPDF